MNRLEAVFYRHRIVSYHTPYCVHGTRPSARYYFGQGRTLRHLGLPRPLLVPLPISEDAGFPHTIDHLQCWAAPTFLEISQLPQSHFYLCILLHVFTMSNASLPPNAPTTNGVATHGHGEADVPSSHHPANRRLTLEEVCAQLHSQVTAFLSAEPSDDVTRRTQEQSRIALGVIDKALRDYE